MNKSHWILVAFVATMVCNCSCRPRDVDVKNIYPVYRSEKQLELEATNRYEKKYKEKPGDGSVSYHRIDIPYKNGVHTTGELAVKNNSKSVMDYVPVAITIKRPNIKIWPSDQNGIESPDDLSLYNVYTNNINPLNSQHVTTPGHNHHYHYTSHKPSIFILEELTTRKPFYDYDSVYTQPIQVLDRPPQVHQFYPSPTSRPPEYPSTISAVYRPTEQSSTTDTVHYPTTHQETTTETMPPTETPLPETPTHAPPQTTPRPETTTRKRKKNKCPNVSITASSVINNSNSIKKEGCQDINIQINTDVSNSNSGSVTPGKPSNTVFVVTGRPTNSNPSSNPVVVVPTNQTGLGFGVFDAIWSIFSRIFNFSFLNPGGSLPLSNLFNGLSALFLPWIFPHLLFYGVRRQKRFAVARNEFVPTHFDRFFDTHQKRTTRDGVGGSPKKISRYK